MRNRVALAAAKLGRVSVVLGLALVAVVIGAQAAVASTADGVAASNMQFPIGPVGVAAVVVGLGGLVTGLVRHRRRELALRPVPAVSPVPEPIVPDPAAA